MAQPIKSPYPTTKNQMPLDLARTQSAPPEGKEAELGALKNKANNISSQQLSGNQSSQPKKLSLKSVEFFSNPQTNSFSFQGNPSNITTPPPPATKMEIEQKVLANVSKYNEKQLQNQQVQSQGGSTSTETKPKTTKKMKLNVGAASFTIAETKEEKSEWDKPLPKIPSTSKPLQMKKPVLPSKNPINNKPSINSGTFQNKDFPEQLEKIEEDTKKEEDHEKELKEKKEKEEREQLEKESLEKERLEKERLENESLEKERLEKERLEKERLEKEKLENERLEKERLEKERIEKERLEKERIEKEKLEREQKEKEEKQQRNHENIGTSVIQKGQNKVTKQYLINLIESGRKSNIEVPEYLKIISNREMKVDYSDRRTTYKKPANIPEPKREEKFERGSKIAEKEEAEKIYRSAIDPKSQEIKDKINSWTNAKITEKKSDPMKIVENNIRSNLNILTPDNFKIIREKILEIARNNKDNIDILVQKIIEKAWVEPKYIETYAQLCYFLQNEKSLDDSKSKSSEGSKKKANNFFKSKLLEKIQKAFETEEVLDQKLKDKYAKMTNEEKEYFNKQKMNKILGNVKFIGELHLHKVIPQKVIHICACSMFEKFQKEYFRAIGSQDSISAEDFEYNLEGIIKLFDRVGKSYDKDREKEMSKEEITVIDKFMKQFQDLEKLKKTDYQSIFNDSQEKITTNGIFRLLEFLRDNIRLPTKKIATLIDNLLDRRSNDWKDKLLSNEGPKTIHDLHTEYYKELEEQDKRLMENEDLYDNRYSSNRGNKSNQKQVIYEKKDKDQPVFQVYAEKKNERNEEEKKEYNPDKKIKLDFSIDRNKTTSKNILKDSKMSKSEVETNVGLIIKRLNEKRDEEKDNEYNENNCYEDLLQLLQKANHNDVVSRFLHDYYDALPAEVEKRLFIPYKLVLEGGVKKEDFLKEFGLNLSKIWANISDFPHLLSSFAKIFFEFAKNDVLKYSDIEIDWTGGEKEVTEDTVDEIKFVLKDFVEASCKLLKSNDSFTKKEPEILSFISKFKLPNNDWYEKMKKRI